MNDVELLGKSILNLNKTQKKMLTLSDVEEKENIKHVETFDGMFYKKNGQVEFVARIKLKDVTNNTVKIDIFKSIPMGYRLADIYTVTSRNVPINVARFADPKTFLATSLAENNKANQLIFYANSNGNYYLQGFWMTDD